MKKQNSFGLIIYIKEKGENDMHDMGFYKEFKKSFKGKENAGYVEWSLKVKAELVKMSDTNLLNMKKRFEWNLNMSKNDEKGWFSKYIERLSPLAILFITLMVNVQTSYQNLFSAVEDTKNIVMSDINVFRDIYGEWFEVIMETCNDFIVLMIGFVAIAYIIDWAKEKSNEYKMLYYAEMLELITNEYDTKKEK